MNNRFPIVDYGLLTPVLGYAHLAITRAEIRSGDLPKLVLLRACGERSALHQRLQQKFMRGMPAADSGLLGTPQFIGQMRAETFRRLAKEANNQHERILMDKTVSPVNQDRLEWGDYPNGFIRMAQYLIIVAGITDEQVRDHYSLGIERTISEAHLRMHELTRRQAARRKQQHQLPRP